VFVLVVVMVNLVVGDVAYAVVVVDFVAYTVDYTDRNDYDYY